MEFDCHEFVQLGSIATLLLSLPLAESLEHNRGISNAEPSTEVIF